MLADMSGLPVRIPETADLACVGAAILAGVGCGIYESGAEGYACMAVTEQTVYPDLNQTAMYQARMKTYRKLANQLVPIKELF